MEIHSATLSLKSNLNNHKSMKGGRGAKKKLFLLLEEPFKYIIR
ncbi:hypothetical protein SAMN05444266_101107 [Chitinophaga jiangningensis]|uniref:Uncharacterized protein n=1 Tax=Chitinophaga jiangningensis TaxID=1419482 RepID=A0A1M6V8F1_9BACT|nr:hypothetical protein SAMN05444266_101107 [Chitinophaga jiangningensis]